MCLVNTMKINNISIRIHDDYIPKDTQKYKDNLKTFYDTANLIFQDKDKKDLFYTKDELEQVKKDNNYEFI